VLNIIYIIDEYNNVKIYLSKRIQKDKEMYNMWQSPGGKVEKGESSIQAVRRETLEETGIHLEEEDVTYLLNDPNFNCDVYFTLLDEEQIPKTTKPQKQSAWKLFDLEKYKQLAQERKTTPRILPITKQSSKR